MINGPKPMNIHKARDPTKRQNPKSYKVYEEPL